MTLLQGIVYYVFAFIFTTAFIVAGCFCGSALRKRKDKKNS